MSIEKIRKVAKEFYNTTAKETVFENGILLYLAVSGSHLYGCDRETSDADIKGVFLPYEHDVLNYGHPKSINLKGEVDGIPVDFECWSFQYLQHLLYKGDSNVIDMLYSQTYEDAVLFADKKFLDIFSIANLKQYILFNKMTGIIGYCQRQAEKYGVKGTRVNEMVEFVDQFVNISSNLSDGEREEMRLGEIFHLFDLNKFHHIKIVQLNKKTTTEFGISVLGRIFPQYLRLSQVQSQCDAIISSYGGRSLDAADSNGNDWKAMSHAYRAGVEYLNIMTTGMLTFPLPQAPMIRAIKLGECSIDHVKVELEELIDATSKMDDGTVFKRDKPSLKFLQKSTIDLYKNAYPVSKKHNIMQLI